MNHNDSTAVKLVADEKLEKSGKTYRPHLDIAIWLNTLELEQYSKIFAEFGGVEDLLDYTGRDVLNLGVTSSAHRARLVTSLAILKEKYRKALARRSLGAMNRPVSPLSAARTDGYINSRTGTEGHWTDVDKKSSRTDIPTTQNDNKSISCVMKIKTQDRDLNENIPSVNGCVKIGLNGVEENSGEQMNKKVEDFSWYHGRLSRKEAEKLVEKNGMFLVRDCISQPDDFVLTCNNDGTPVHFMVNRMVLPSTIKNGENWNSVHLNLARKTTLFQFEEEQFSTVPDLVEFYVNHGKPITVLSKCVIKDPVPKPAIANSRSASHQQMGNINNGNQKPDKTSVDFIDFDDTQPGNYALMNRKLPTVPSPPRRMGIPNLKIPSFNPNLTKRPLPKPPSVTGTDLEEKSSPPTFRNRQKSDLAKKPLSQRVMLLEASRLLAKSTSEGKLTGEKPSLVHYNSARELTNGTLATNEAGIPAIRDTVNCAPSKPQRAPSLKHRERPTVIVRNKLGNFQEETVSAPMADDDYHEYCDIDYDEIDSNPNRRSLLANSSHVTCPSGSSFSESNHVYASPQLFCANSNHITRPLGAFASTQSLLVKSETSKEPHSRHSMATSASTQSLLARKADKFLSKPPPLPARKVHDPYLERDSACVPDFNVYDEPVPSRLARNLVNTGEKAGNNRVKLVQLTVRKKINLKEFETGECFCDKSELKPFDKEIWSKLSGILLDADPMSVAKSVTKVDCDFLDVFATKDREWKISEKMESGFPLVLLPQGEEFRKELRSRSETLKTFVIGTVVKCCDGNERVRMLKQWIETCRCLRFQVLNEFAFESVIKALSSPQISGLRTCWNRLRTEHTPSAVCFETILKPAVSNLGKVGSKSSVQECDKQFVIPHLQPVLRLMDAKIPEETSFYDWEEYDKFFGMDAMWSLLESSRKWFNEGLNSTNKQLAEERISLPSSCCSLETKNGLQKLSQTEFQLQILWGSKGALVESEERMEKMEKLLTLMANKVELETN